MTLEDFVLLEIDLRIDAQLLLLMAYGVLPHKEQFLCSCFPLARHLDHFTPTEGQNKHQTLGVKGLGLFFRSPSHRVTRSQAHHVSRSPFHKDFLLEWFIPRHETLTNIGR